MSNERVTPGQSQAADQSGFVAQGRFGKPQRELGVALVVSLIMLIVVTLIGLAAVQSTTMQTRMASNFYDRSIAFQSAEAGLAAGADSLLAGTTNIRNCGSGGVICAANPFDDSTLAAANVVTIVTGTTYAAGSNAAAQPQYVIESMGTFLEPSLDTGFGQTANAAQYGTQNTPVTATFYRITSRSGDPAVVGERALVTLQAMYKR